MNIDFVFLPLASPLTFVSYFLFVLLLTSPSSSLLFRFLLFLCVLLVLPLFTFLLRLFFRFTSSLWSRQPNFSFISSVFISSNFSRHRLSHFFLESSNSSSHFFPPPALDFFFLCSSNSSLPLFTHLQLFLSLLPCSSSGTILPYLLTILSFFLPSSIFRLHSFSPPRCLIFSDVCCLTLNPYIEFYAFLPSLFFLFSLLRFLPFNSDLHFPIFSIIVFSAIP